MPKTQRIERSAGAVGNTRERITALHPLLSLLFSPLRSLLPPAPPFATLLAPLAFHSHLFLCFASSLSEYHFLSYALPSLAASSFPLFSLTPTLPLFLSFFFCWNLQRLTHSAGINECALNEFFFFLNHKQPHPKLGISLPLSFFLSTLASPSLISTNKPIFNSYFLCAAAVSGWEVMHRKCRRLLADILVLFAHGSILIHCFLYLA